MRVKALILAAVAALGASVATVPAATAAPGNTVLLGDSLMANPSVAQYMTQKGLPLDKSPMSRAGCASDFRFADAYRSVKGGDVDNYACSGASFHTGGKHMSELADMAARQGRLNAGTREVVLLAGANDTYPYVLNDKLPVPKIQDNLRISMERTINQVKRQAPNAHIKLVGYTNITTPRGDVCYLNLIPGPGTPSPTVRIRPIEDTLQRAGIDAARNTGVTFVDTKGISNGKDTCSPNRWITGIIDVAPQHRNLAFHLTHQGINEVGKHAARA